MIQFKHCKTQTTDIQLSKHNIYVNIYFLFQKQYINLIKIYYPKVQMTLIHKCF